MSERQEHPVRPGIPTAFWLFGAAFLGARATLWADGLPAWALALLGAATLAAFAACRRWHLRFVALALLSCLCAGASAQAQVAMQHRAVEELQRTPVSSWQLTVQGEGRQGRYGWTCVGLAQSGDARARVWLRSDAELPVGEEIVCVGRFSAAEDDDFGRAGRQRGIVGSVRVLRVSAHGPPEGAAGLLHGLRGTLLGSLDLSDPGHALAAGAVLGLRGPMRALGIEERFSRTGLSHLVAVSGTHLGLLAALVGSALAHSRARPRSRALVTAGVTGAYVAVCGAPVSAVRAWLMASVGAGAALGRRRGQGLATLGLVGTALVLVSPTVTGELGFCLSFACVAALGLLGPLAGAWARALLAPPPLPRRLRDTRAASRLRGAARLLQEAVAASLTCLVAAAPLGAAAFGQASPVAPLASVLVGGLFGPFLLVALAALAASPLPVVGAGAARLLSMAGGALCALAQALAQIPLASVPCAVTEPCALAVTVAVVGCLWAWWPRPPRPALAWGALGAVAAVVGGCLFLAQALVPPRLVVLDVGQGDALLVQDGLHRVLVDAGPDDAVVQALLRNGVTSLDAVVVTHQHDDHYGGLACMAGSLRVGRVIVAQGTGGSLSSDLATAVAELGAPVEEVSVGDCLQVGSWRLEVLAPAGPVDGDQNSESLCLALRRGDAAQTWALLMGDAEGEELAGLLGTVGEVSVLKVGHHGSEPSLSPQQARALRPLVAVASAGEGNRYGHPSAACREACASAGASFWCTKDVGDIDLRPEGTGVRVLTGRPQEGAFAYD